MDSKAAKDRSSPKAAAPLSWGGVFEGCGPLCLASDGGPVGGVVRWWRLGQDVGMKMVVLRSWLAAVAALGESLAILDLKGVVPLLPEGWAVWVAGVPTLAALVVHVVKGVGDSLKEMELKGE